ncbi:MAG: adenylyltransferase [Candidatus Omnitrophica bacterium CG11_big_fil_rev_8_21_14_0_20_63_9]|nr:MAG: adenylyltransferase [Candidatus Omnitrophica bacterium CG11_big_fil_rev_8_21_14_0_20_63_9]
MGLSKEQVARYSRQLILPEIGVQGQQQLLASSALVIGAGGLGSPVALYLAAAGVGTIGIIDADAVSLSNLHRQVLHTTGAVGEPKSRSAKARLEALNPEIIVTPLQERVTAANALALFSNYDVIVDGSDNFPTRYLANDACVLSGKPLIHGGVVHFGGQVLTVVPREGACYRCVFPEPPEAGAVPNCQEAGVFGAAAGVIGTLMANEVIKVLLALGRPLVNRLLVFEGLAGHFREVSVRRNPECAVCGDNPTIREVVSLESIVCTTGQEAPWPGNK